MKKLLALLLLSPLAYSLDYVFVCTTEEGKTTSVLINTGEKFIKLGQLKFDDDWKKDDIDIKVIENNIYENENAIVEFNTVTGNMTQILFKKGKTGETLEDNFLNQYRYSCKPASRLIP
tara:strand:+ start:676 stop:1032 length:357 start_codon:yes stop_codon:yes gene_type:complete